MVADRRTRIALIKCSAVRAPRANRAQFRTGSIGEACPVAKVLDAIDGRN